MPRKRRTRRTAHLPVPQTDQSRPVMASPLASQDHVSSQIPLRPSSLTLSQHIHLLRVYGHSTMAGPSSSALSSARTLPLDWTESECSFFSYHLYKNSKDFDDTIEWWGRIAVSMPGKTVQELRLFSYLYMRSYGELPPDPREASESESSDSDLWEFKPLDSSENKTIEIVIPEIEMPNTKQSETDQESSLLSEGHVLQKYFDWTLEESRSLLDLIEKHPSILKSRRGWKRLADQFTGKTASDVKRHLTMIQLAAIFMGALDLNSSQQKARIRGDEKTKSSQPGHESKSLASEMISRLQVSSEETVASSTGNSIPRPTLQPASPKPCSSRSERGGGGGEVRGGSNASST